MPETLRCSKIKLVNRLGQYGRNFNNRALKQVHCKRILDKEILCRDGKELSAQDFHEIQNCGYVPESYRKMDLESNEAFDSLYFMNVTMTETELQKGIQRIMEDSSCGDVFRIKGFKDRNFIYLH